jgi:hypothetical protein
MGDPDTDPSVQESRTAATAGASEARPCRWPALLAVCIAPWLPAMTARRTKDLPLLRAYGVHLLCAFLALVLISLLAWLDDGEHPFELLAAILGEFAEESEAALLVTGIIVLLLEGGFALAALAAAPWGARDEPLGASFRSAFRQTWLRSGHALVIIVAVGLLIVPVSRAERAYWSGSPVFAGWPAAPVEPVGVAQDSQAWRDYEAALTDYEAEITAYNAALGAAWSAFGQRPKPFLAKYGPVLIMNAILLSAVWLVWGLLRAVSADRGVPPVARAPLCEACGYNLTGSAMDGRCPECGRAVLDSLRPDTRPGTEWERRRELGVSAAYFATVSDTFRRPGVPGEEMAVLSFRHDHALLTAWHTALAFLIGSLGVVINALILEPHLRRAPDELLMVAAGFGPLVSLSAVLAMLGWAGLCAVIVGVLLWSAERRNFLHAAMRVASHHSFWLIPWAIVTGGQCTVLIVLGHLGILDNWARLFQTGPETVVAVSVILVNLAMGLWYLRLIWRGTSAARYANR